MHACNPRALAAKTANPRFFWIMRFPVGGPLMIRGKGRLRNGICWVLHQLALACNMHCHVAPAIAALIPDQGVSVQALICNLGRSFPYISTMDLVCKSVPNAMRTDNRFSESDRQSNRIRAVDDLLAVSKDDLVYHERHA